MTGRTVVLNEDFEYGTLDNVFFKDLKFLSKEQIASLSVFIDKVSKGQPLVGKNKPSWLSDDGSELPYTETYKYYGYWHYHCGPTYASTLSYSMTHDLRINLNGLTSSEVIHYTREEDGSIVVQAYSPQHTPFPASDHPKHKNPLFD